MIDSGATGLFLNSSYAQKHHMVTRPLHHPIKLYNIDGSPNRAGSITHSVRLMTRVDKNPSQLLEFLVTDLGNENIILGLPWLRRVNPNIDWEKGRLQIPTKGRKGMTIEEVTEPEERNRGGVTDRLMEINEHYIPLPDEDADDDLEIDITPDKEESSLYRITGNRKQRRAWLRAGFIQEMGEEISCAAGFTYSQQLAEATNQAKTQKTFEEMVPSPY